MNSVQGVIFLWIAASTLARHASMSHLKTVSCARACTGTNRLNYQKGFRYTYKYTAATSTFLQGHASESSGLAVESLVVVDVLAKCQMVLSLRGVRIKGTTANAEEFLQDQEKLRTALERHSLHFSFQDGRIPEICPSEGEETWALNVKRGVLSALQDSRAATKQGTAEEVDVSGRCPSKYTWRGDILVKTKDLSLCSLRTAAVTSLQSMALPDAAFHRRILDSRLECVRSYGNGGVLASAACNESNAFRPFSSRGNGAETETLVTLRLLTVAEEISIATEHTGSFYRSTLLYERERTHAEGRAGSSAEEVAEMVRQLCAVKGLTLESADLFMTLIYNLRSLGVTELRDLWRRSPFKCRDNGQPLIDTLPACGTEACLSFLTEIILSKDVDEDVEDAFLRSLAFIPEPTAPMIATITELMKSPDVRSHAYLGVSSLVHNFCVKNRGCDTVPEIQELMKSLEVYLQENCGARESEKKEKVLWSLKAVGNAGLSAETLVPTLGKCAQSQTNLLEVRLAAVHAFRRVPCQADRSALLQLYLAVDEDSELRIASYYMVMKCPSERLFETVKRTLRAESYSQVGSFVWTHLSQLMETNDPLKQDLRDSLPSSIVSQDFDLEHWKYSSYMDATFSSDSLPFGANVEAALVFSPKSFVPRSAMANLTVYVMGRAVNLLELNLRVENAEHLVQKLFGRKPSPPVAKRAGRRWKARRPPVNQKQTVRREAVGKYAASKQRAETSRDREEKPSCRSANYNHIHHLVNKFTKRLPKKKSLVCHLGVKVFGNELNSVDCSDMRSQLKQYSLDVAEIAIRLLKGKEVQYNKRTSLATEHLMFPSVSGLPIKLAVNASAATSIRMKGNVDLKQWSDFYITGFIKPSAQVQVSVHMGVEGKIGRAGVEWVAGMRTLTSLDGGIHLKKGQDLKVFLNTPEQSMEVIDISSRLYTVNPSGREEIIGSLERVEERACSQEDVSRQVGWQICSEISYPSDPSGPGFPLSGPADASLMLIKRDTGLRQYLLEAAYHYSSQKEAWLPEEAGLHFFLGTPKSDINRDVAVDVQLSYPKRKLSARIIHPQKKIKVEGEIKRVKGSSTGLLEVLIDERDAYYIKGWTDLRSVDGEQMYFTLLEAKFTKRGRPLIMSGNVTRVFGKRIALSASLRNVLKETATVSVNLERKSDEKQRQYSIEADAYLPQVLGCQMVGLLQERGTVWSSALRAKYGLFGNAQNLHHECNIAQKIKRESGPGESYKLQALQEFYCSEITSYNHKLQVQHEESESRSQTQLQINYGKHWDEINNKKKIFITQLFKNDSSPSLASYLMEFTLQMPERQASYRTELTHTWQLLDHTESNTQVKVLYNDKTPFLAGLQWKDSSKPSLKKWEGSLNLDTPWLYLQTSHKLNQPHSRAYQSTVEITAAKAIEVKKLVLYSYFKDKGNKKEGRIHIHTPTTTYVKVSAVGHIGESFFRSHSEVVSRWNLPIKSELSMESKEKLKSLYFWIKQQKKEFNFTANCANREEPKKKRSLSVLASWTDHKAPPLLAQLNGQIEELKKEKLLFQNRASLYFRHSFKLPVVRNFFLQEMFTVDKRKQRYVLEVKALVNEKDETVHTLTLGYQPKAPYVCATLVHPYSAEFVPRHMDVCVRTETDNATKYRAEATVKIDRKETLMFHGQYQNKSTHTDCWYLVHLGMAQALKLRVPTALMAIGEVFGKQSEGQSFDYGTSCKITINKTETSQFHIRVNGSSSQVGFYSEFSHPYNTTMPQTLQAYTIAKSYGETNYNGTFYLHSDGADVLVVEFDAVNENRSNERLIGVTAGVRQNFLSASENSHFRLSGKASDSRCSLVSSLTLDDRGLEVDLMASTEDTEGFLVVFGGSVSHNLVKGRTMPQFLLVAGNWRQDEDVNEGELSVALDSAVYRIHLQNNNTFGGFGGGEGGGVTHHLAVGLAQNGSLRIPAVTEFEGRLELGQELREAWACCRADAKSVCFQLSQVTKGNQTKVSGKVTHNLDELTTTGLPADGTFTLNYDHTSTNRAVRIEMESAGRLVQASVGMERTFTETPVYRLTASLRHSVEELRELGLPLSASGSYLYQNLRNGFVGGVIVGLSGRQLRAEIEQRRTARAAEIFLSFSQDLEPLPKWMPTAIQVNCSGETSSRHLLGHCSGAVDGERSEVQVLLTKHRLRHCSTVELRHHRHRGLHFEGCYHPMGRRTVRAGLVHSLEALTSLGVPRRARLVTSYGRRPGERAVAFFSLEADGSRTVARAEVRARPLLRSRMWRWAGSYRRSGGGGDGGGRGGGEGGGAYAADVRVNLSIGSGGDERLSLSVAGEVDKNLFTGGFRLSDDRAQLNASLELRPSPGTPGWSAERRRWRRPRPSPDVPEPPRAEGDVYNAGGSLGAALDAKPVDLELGASWGQRHGLELVLRHALPAWSRAGIARRNRLSARATAGGRAHSVDADLTVGQCRASASGHLRRGLSTEWRLALVNQCPYFEGLSPARLSVNGSLRTDRCEADFVAHVRVDKSFAQLQLRTACSPKLSLDLGLRHSASSLAAAGVPTDSRILIRAARAPKREASAELTFGGCGLKALGEVRAKEGARTDWSGSLMNRCHSLERLGVPQDSEARGSVHIHSCGVGLKAGLRSDGKTAELQLETGCHPRYTVQALLKHTLPQLSSRGLPGESRLVLSAVGGAAPGGSVLLQSGKCRVRAGGDLSPGPETTWSWETETDCQLLQDFKIPAQSQFNGSVQVDKCKVELVTDLQVDGNTAHLRLRSECEPKVNLAIVFQHRLPMLEAIPQEARLSLGAEQRPGHHNLTFHLTLGTCDLQARGSVRVENRIELNFVMENKCKTLQDLGAPFTIDGSGYVTMGENLDSQIQVDIDGSQLQGRATMNNTASKQEIEVSLTHNIEGASRLGLPRVTLVAITTERRAHTYSRSVRLHLNHKRITEDLMFVHQAHGISLDYKLTHNIKALKQLHIEDLIEVQATLELRELKILSVKTQYGSRLANLEAQGHISSARTEITGNVQHNWPQLLRYGVSGSLQMNVYLQTVAPVEGSLQIILDGASPIKYEFEASSSQQHFNLIVKNSHSNGKLRAVGYPLEMVLAFATQRAGTKSRSVFEAQYDGRNVKISVDGSGSFALGAAMELTTGLDHTIPFITQLGVPPSIEASCRGMLNVTELRISLKLRYGSNASLHLSMEGQNQQRSKELHLTMLQDFPALLRYVPGAVAVQSEVDYAGRWVKGKLNVTVEESKLAAFTMLRIDETGYSEVLELTHTFPRWKGVPKRLECSTAYLKRGRTHTLSHAAKWEDKELDIWANYSGPFPKIFGRHGVHVDFHHPFTSVSFPADSNLRMSFSHSRLSHQDAMIINWDKKDQVAVLASLLWEKNRLQSKANLRHPFNLSLRELEINSLSERNHEKYRQQAHISWNGGRPIDLNFTLEHRLEPNESTWDACMDLTTGQLQSALVIRSLQACGFTRNSPNSVAESLQLHWDDKRIDQSFDYQRHRPDRPDDVKVALALANVLLSSCGKQNLLGRIQTDYRSQLNHYLKLSFCKSIKLAGKHQKNKGKVIISSETRLGLSSDETQDLVAGMSLRDYGKAEVKNYSLNMEWRASKSSRLNLLGGYTASTHSRRITLEGLIDQKDRVKLAVTHEKGCLKYYTSVTDGVSGEEGVRLVACSDGRSQAKAELYRSSHGGGREELGHISAAVVNQSHLRITAQGCGEVITRAETKISQTVLHLKARLLEKVNDFDQRVWKFRKSVEEVGFLSEASGLALKASRKASSLIRDGGDTLRQLWGQSRARGALLDLLPSYLAKLQDMWEQLQGELQKPVATLKGAYYDATLKELDEEWRRKSERYLEKVQSFVPNVVQETWLMHSVQSVLYTTKQAFDLAAQQLLKWTEAKISQAISKIRKPLANLYKHSQGNCSVTVNVPWLTWGQGRLGVANITNYIVETKLIKTLRSLYDINPTAEYYRLKHRMMDSPFEHQALLIGDKHCMTFDGEMYDLATPCSFLLAKDFLRNSFTVTLNHDSGGRRSLRLAINRTFVDIYPGLKVEEDCEPSDLPRLKNGATVKREPNRVEVSNQNGVTLTCDAHHAVCSLTLSGWDHGVSAGLFGTNDNEVGNEFTLPDHSLTADRQEFAQKWQTDPHCRLISGEIKSCSDNAFQYICKSLFKDTYSPFSNCFRVVDPAPFYHMCLSDMCQTSDLRPACNLAAAFVHLCNRNFVPLSVPSQCASPRKPEKMQQDGVRPTEKLAAIPSADLVILMEEKGCDKLIAAALPALVNSLLEAFRNQGVTDVRVGLVGFGETGDGSNLTYWRRRLGIETGDPTRFTHKDSRNLTDAVRLATQWPFRTGASKSAILLPCSSCHPHAKLSAETLRETLRSSGLVLYLLKETAWRPEGRASLASAVGVDGSDVTTASWLGSEDTPSSRPPARHRAAVEWDDVCVRAAIESGGAVLDSTSLDATDRSSARSFSRRVASLYHRHHSNNSDNNGNNNGDRSNQNNNSHNNNKNECQNCPRTVG